MIDNRSLKVDGIRLAYFFLILPTVFPFGLSVYLNIYSAATLAKFISFILLFIIWAVTDHRINKYMGLVFLFVASLFISTAINDESIYRWAIDVVGILNVVIWMQLAVKKRQLDLMIKDLKNFALLIVIINIFSYFIAPGGIATVFTGNAYSACDLISNNNSVAPYVVPACFLSIFYCLWKEKCNLRKEIIIFILFFCVLFYAVTGAGMLIALLTVLLYLLMKYNRRFSYFLSIKKLIIMLAIIFFIICVFQATNWLGILFTAFDSNVTLTGRTLLWEYGMKLISQKPVFGHGISENNYMQGYLRIVTVHNMYFQIAIWGGFVSLTLIVMTVIEAMKSVHKYWGRRSDVIPIGLGVIGVLIYFMVEVHVSVPFFWILLSIAYYYEEIVEVNRDHESNY